MCSDRNIAYIDRSNYIQQNHINESNAHLNRYGTIVSKNTFSKFLLEHYSWDRNSSNKNHLVQDNLNKEWKSYLKVLVREN